jgi:hypothetical protein
MLETETEKLRQYYARLPWLARILLPQALRHALTTNNPLAIFEAACTTTWFFQRWFFKGLRDFLNSPVVKNSKEMFDLSIAERRKLYHLPPKVTDALLTMNSHPLPRGVALENFRKVSSLNVDEQIHLGELLEKLKNNGFFNQANDHMYFTMVASMPEKQRFLSVLLSMETLNAALLSKANIQHMLLIPAQNRDAIIFLLTHRNYTVQAHQLFSIQTHFDILVHTPDLAQMETNARAAIQREQRLQEEARLQAARDEAQRTQEALNEAQRQQNVAHQPASIHQRMQDEAREERLIAERQQHQAREQELERQALQRQRAEDELRNVFATPTQPSFRRAGPDHHASVLDDALGLILEADLFNSDELISEAMRHANPTELASGLTMLHQHQGINAFTLENCRTVIQASSPLTEARTIVSRGTLQQHQQDEARRQQLREEQARQRAQESFNQAQPTAYQASSLDEIINVIIESDLLNSDELIEAATHHPSPAILAAGLTMLHANHVENTFTLENIRNVIQSSSPLTTAQTIIRRHENIIAHSQLIRRLGNKITEQQRNAIYQHQNIEALTQAVTTLENSRLLTNDTIRQLILAENPMAVAQRHQQNQQFERRRPSRTMRSLANNSESSMQSLTPSEQAILDTIKAYYQLDIDLINTNHISQNSSAQYYAERYQSNSASIIINGRQIELPLRWQDFQRLADNSSFSPEVRQRAKEAYRDNINHTQFRQHNTRSLSARDKPSFLNVLKELASRYELTPLVVEVSGRRHSLPLTWEEFDSLKTQQRWSVQTTTEILKRYYQDPVHTAYRYLNGRNQWRTNPAFNYAANLNNQEELIAILWLAVSDRNQPTTNGYTIETRIDRYITELASMGRAHNWDRERPRNVPDTTYELVDSNHATNTRGKSLFIRLDSPTSRSFSYSTNRLFSARDTGQILLSRDLPKVVIDAPLTLEKLQRIKLDILKVTAARGHTDTRRINEQYDDLEPDSPNCGDGVDSRLYQSVQDHPLFAQLLTEDILNQEVYDYIQNQFKARLTQLTPDALRALNNIFEDFSFMGVLTPEQQQPLLSYNLSQEQQQAFIERMKQKYHRFNILPSAVDNAVENNDARAYQAQVNRLFAEPCHVVRFMGDANLMRAMTHAMETLNRHAPEPQDDDDRTTVSASSTLEQHGLFQSRDSSPRSSRANSNASDSTASFDDSDEEDRFANVI